MTKSIHLIYMVTLAFLMHNTLFAQDLEPRRWTPLPAGTTIVGLTYANISGDIGFDPVLEIEDAKVDKDLIVMSYTHFFSLAGKSLRFDALLPWHNVKWDGLLSGEPADTQRTDIGDPRFRLSMTLLNTSTQASEVSDTSKEIGTTVVGAAIAVTVPWGEYYDEKLLNIGTNRYTIRPQIGIVHTRGPWSYELTGSVFFFTDNDRFYNGNTLEQDPFYAVQAHIIRVFSPGVWGSLSAGYGEGSQTTVNGRANDDRRDGFITALSFGLPITANQGLKFSYIRSDVDTDATNIAQVDTLAVGWSIRF